MILNSDRGDKNITVVWRHSPVRLDMFEVHGEVQEHPSRSGCPGNEAKMRRHALNEGSSEVQTGLLQYTASIL